MSVDRMALKEMIKDHRIRVRTFRAGMQAAFSMSRGSSTLDINRRDIMLSIGVIPRGSDAQAKINKILSFQYICEIVGRLHDR